MDCEMKWALIPYYDGDENGNGNESLSIFSHHLVCNIQIAWYKKSIPIICVTNNFMIEKRKIQHFGLQTLAAKYFLNVCHNNII